MILAWRLVLIDTTHCKLISADDWEPFGNLTVAVASEGGGGRDDSLTEAVASRPALALIDRQGSICQSVSGSS